MSRPVPRSAMLVTILIVSASALFGQRIGVTSNLRAGALPIASKTATAKIFYSTDDHKVVQFAAKDLASDIERVTRKRPSISTDKPTGDVAIIIGTLGKSPLIDSIADGRKLEAAKIRGKWESFIIKTIERPLPNVERALVIAGSDRRGTAFGVYEVSQIIGVSPWYWWADATPEPREDLILTSGSIVSREPSVKYRGIFINDEDWGLQPWAAKTFEPETGDIGPKTYAKVFELLLRLKANTLWPAMHEVTRPFNSIPANRQVADDYAIVMGSSHAEPMLRNNVGEWKADKNDYNFVTNPEGVTAYWEERAKENGRFENIYTIGMRGIHDSPILGTKSQAERIPLLEKIFSVQRGLLAKHVDPNVGEVPQIFCPYKEVLADYRAGLKVPDDVTVVFPDDNFGYIRQFPNAEERKRKGGFGVYYHISYLGRPFAYLWLNTTPPALIWQEMNKAYENGMRQLWIVNIGDIKPGEIGMEFFLQMAYDADRWTIDSQERFLREFAEREFGREHGAEIADILGHYYRLGYQRKPEHLQWYLPNETPRPSALTRGEKLERLDAYSSIWERGEKVFREVPVEKKYPFYQLVHYPVRVAALANQRFFAAEIAREYESLPATAIEWAKFSVGVNELIGQETQYFNEIMSNGKWRHMMSPEMNPGQWPSMRATVPKISPADFPAPAENDRPLILKRTEARRSEQSYEGVYTEIDKVISIEAENFHRSLPAAGYSWRVIKGLGKTGDSVSIFPSLAKTFAAAAPSLEYHIEVENPGEFDVSLFLIPTQPLVPGGGLRLAYSVDGNQPTRIAIDKDTEVSSRKWAQNILDASVVGTAKVVLTKGRHRLRIHGVDTGVVLDKIVLSSKPLTESYFGPPGTQVVSHKR
ncbi:MAG TPA: glycosyl hydrolase 115 family protein [Pyrinomonadaceae bacterium]